MKELKSMISAVIRI